MEIQEEQITIRVIIEGGLKDILRSAKEGSGYMTKKYMNEMFGSLLTLKLLEIIDEQVYLKCVNLIYTIQKKYHF